jgi:inorganic phosphate transporter, PiT family
MSRSRPGCDTLLKEDWLTQSDTRRRAVPEIPWAVIVLIALALVYGFLNGFHDSSNIVATTIASRALSGQQALAITALAEFMGPFLFGVAVATTIGTDVVDIGEVTLSVVIVALMAAISWSVLTWWLGIPSSSSHALVGGLVGAAVVESGWGAINFAGLGMVLLALIISPPLGMLAGYLVMKVTLFLSRGSSPSINEVFKRGQVLTGLALALSHGANDGQKTMGIIAMGLVIAGVLPTFAVPQWVIAASGAVLALGTFAGGWRLIRTLGSKFYRIRPVHGFATQSASASVILSAALLGGPVSTTQVVSSAIMGVGSAERMSKVRWGTAGQIATTWLITIPVTAVLAAVLEAILRMVI